MERVLQIVNHMGVGGIQAFIMNVYRNIDKNKVQFDFLLNQNIKESYVNEIEALGGHIFYVPARREGIHKNRAALDAFFSMHPEYRIVHMHESTLSYIEPLIYAKKHGVQVRIIHSHSTKANGSALNAILHTINKQRISQIATHFFSCGNLAGKWFYGGTRLAKKHEVINNGIKISDYRFDEDMREKKRKELCVPPETYVVGHVGRFNTVKNHSFLIDVFCEILRRRDDSVLCLAGDGPLRSEIENKCNELGIIDRIRFLGNRKDINELLQAFDILMMPSLYEGFPVAVLEAEACGLPIVLSDTITREVCIKENIRLCSLSDSAAEWAKVAMSNSDYVLDNSVLYEKRYDIQNTVNRLMEIYLLR